MEKLSKKQTLTLDLIHTYLTGAEIEYDKATSFVGVWESIIARMKAEDRVVTAENYKWSLNSFLKYVGNVKGFMIGKNVIDRWNDVMNNGVVENGKVVGKIADATRGMYLRTLPYCLE